MIADILNSIDNLVCVMSIFPDDFVAYVTQDDFRQQVINYVRSKSGKHITIALEYDNGYIEALYR